MESVRREEGNVWSSEQDAKAQATTATRRKSKSNATADAAATKQLKCLFT